MLNFCLRLPAIVPLTVDALNKRQDNSSPHPGYRATILFQNTFDGQLPATDYPKVNVSILYLYCYFVMSLFSSSIS